MSSLSDTTGDIKIDKTHLWTLSLFIDEGSISIMLHNDKVADSLVCRRIGLPKYSSPEEYLRALENAIYDNPVLLSDFKRVNVCVDSRKFIFLPPGYGTDEEARRAFDVAFPDADGDFVVSRGYNCRTDVAFMLPRGVYRFLMRTFSNVPVRLHLEVLCSYFRGQTNISTINKEAVYIRDGGNVIDVCTFRQGRLQMANTFVCRSSDDVIFYILAIWNNMGFDVYSDEIQITGDRQVRANVIPRLREYVTYVVPVMMPSAAMRIASDAAKAPFNLIALAI